MRWPEALRRIPYSKTGPTPLSSDGIYDDGDYAVVELECSFDLITPIAEAMFGGAVDTIAHEEFPIHREIIQAVPEPPDLPPPCDPGQAESAGHGR